MTESLAFSLLLKSWARSYYALPLMFLLSVAVILYAITAKPKNTMAKVILFFACASSTQFIFDAFMLIYTKRESIIYMQSLAISLFIIIEITCCYCLVTLTKVNLMQKRIMQLLLSLFYLFEIVYITPIFFTDRYNALESFIELPLVIIFTCIYYYNLLTKAPQKHLTQQPLFWVISGMALIAIVQIPCNIVLGYFQAYSKSYSRLFFVITSLSYSLLFVCFLKAIQLYKNSIYNKKTQPKYDS